MNLPPGYAAELVGEATLVARVSVLAAAREALAEGTLYDYAAHHPEARPLSGRGVAYAVALPYDAANVVIRRSRHGGLLAPMTGELFLAPTRAPRELDVAVRLGHLGVPTPELLAYATYPAAPLMRRADIATREVPAAQDLDAALRDTEDDGRRGELLDATATLMRAMTAAGARHPDFNIKNILVTGLADGEPIEALVIDVDRIWFAEPDSDAVRDANLRRLARSARKRRRDNGTPITETELKGLADALGAALADESAQ
ncbi:MAG: lipopolysaccharide kinase InaA family protein [Gemmatimonadota bacterium]|nr:lipopolysaccharide kinase InaA family protein [Gemmatimonadota bacterium]